MERINTDDEARRIVLYVARHADREVTAREIEKEPGIDFESALKRLQLLAEADIVARGMGYDSYQGLQDRMLTRYISLILRGLVEGIGQEQVVRELRRDLEAEVEAIGRALAEIKGRLNQYGEFYGGVGGGRG